MANQLPDAIANPESLGKAPHTKQARTNRCGPVVVILGGYALIRTGDPIIMSDVL